MGRSSAGGGAGRVGAAGSAASHVVLTLDDAIDRGVRASARLREAGARTEMASAVAEQRRAARSRRWRLRPATRAPTTSTRSAAVLAQPVRAAIYPDIPDNYRSRLDLQWPLYNAGRFSALEQAARSESAAADADERTARADLTLEIARAYWTLVTAIEQLGVVEESIAATRAHLEDVRNQLEAGLVAPNDVLTVEAQESRQQLLAIQARGNRDVAEAELARLIGAPQARIQPASPLAPPAPVTAGLESLVAEAASRRARARGALAAVDGRGRADEGCRR